MEILDLLNISYTGFGLTTWGIIGALIAFISSVGGFFIGFLLAKIIGTYDK